MSLACLRSSRRRGQVDVHFKIPLSAEVPQRCLEANTRDDVEASASISLPLLLLWCSASMVYVTLSSGCILGKYTDRPQRSNGRTCVAQQQDAGSCGCKHDNKRDRMLRSVRCRQKNAHEQRVIEVFGVFALCNGDQALNRTRAKKSEELFMKRDPTPASATTGSRRWAVVR